GHPDEDAVGQEQPDRGDEVGALIPAGDGEHDVLQAGLSGGEHHLLGESAEGDLRGGALEDSQRQAEQDVAATGEGRVTPAGGGGAGAPVVGGGGARPGRGGWWGRGGRER